MEKIYKANYLLFLILEAILSHYKEQRYFCGTGMANRLRSFELFKSLPLSFFLYLYIALTCLNWKPFYSLGLAFCYTC